jgi:alpha-tubulin suppressor-like RCC1 family protein
LAAFGGVVLLVGSLILWVFAPKPAEANTVPVVSAGVSHTCALMPSGQVECWGYNNYGELGNGTTTLSTVPVGVAGLPPAVAVAAGSFHTCAIDTSGRAWCWGSNHYGALGNGTNTDSDTPVAVSGGLKFKQISAGGIEFDVGGTGVPGDFTCGVTKGGAVWCWGYGGNGQLGNGTDTSSNVPVQVTRISNAVQIAAGGLHACAALAGGTVRCWGLNSKGQLGNNSTAASDVPVVASGVSGATAVSAGSYHSCALLTSGGVLCWGDNEQGELGNGTVKNSHVALPVAGLAGSAQQITAGGYHTCALVDATETEVECWGEGRDGELGDGLLSEPPVAAPEPVFGVAGSPASGLGELPVQVAAGQEHTCAVISTGQVLCWGWNGKGQIGDGTEENRDLPTLVVGITTGPQQITEGGGAGCAVNQALGVQCWGSVDGNDFNPHTSAQTVTALPSGIAQVTAGDADGCALSTGGGLRCWGENFYGEVGDGSTTATPTPTGVKGLSSGVRTVSTGSSVTCANNAKHLSCWGYNANGQLGDGSSSNSDVPASVPLIAVQVSPADGHTCAVSTNANAFCWGANDYGELGDGTTNNSDNPVKVQGLPADPVQIAAGGGFNGNPAPADFTCVLLSTGGVYCWGYNGNGQLGDGTFTNSVTPVQVGLAGPAKQIVAGAYHACALLMTGAVQCWGGDLSGQLGDGGSADESSPVNVTGLSQVIQISANGAADSACALEATGAVSCWGDNTNDELGDGAAGGFSNTPQAVVGL